MTINYKLKTSFTLKFNDSVARYQKYKKNSRPKISFFFIFRGSYNDIYFVFYSIRSVCISIHSSNSFNKSLLSRLLVTFYYLSLVKQF